VLNLNGFSTFQKKGGIPVLSLSFAHIVFISATTKYTNEETLGKYSLDYLQRKIAILSKMKSFLKEYKK
jgi:hypothetical protein